MNTTNKNISVCDNEHIASQKTARLIAEEIMSKQTIGLPVVLGLATGNTPKLVYHELVRMHKDEGLSFKNVISFNLDEYYPMSPEHPLSYHRFMDTHLFGQVDILPENIHLPQGTWEKEQVTALCASYDKKIQDYGGIDLQLLGIGRNGHIGFNEPGSAFDSPTRLIDLHSITRKDAAADFEGLEKVPLQAVTMGMQTIASAKKIVLLALGVRKAAIIQKTLKADISPETPATFLRTLPQAQYILDREAGALVVESLRKDSQICTFADSQRNKKTMKTDFLDFYHNLEKDQRFEVIEFRLQYKKKLHKYIEFQCPLMAVDLKELQKRYFQRANP